MASSFLFLHNLTPAKHEQSGTIARLATAKFYFQKGIRMIKENESTTFHNEGAISRISLWANIIGYTILVFGLIGFTQQAYQLITNWSQIAPGLPENFFERISIFVTNVFMDPLVSPEMNWRWSSRKSTMMGTDTSVAAAIISP